MFIPFNIKKSTIEDICRYGNYEYDTDEITRNLKAHINLDTIKQTFIEGTRLQEECFPSECYDSLFQVFISHSHSDETSVKQLAGFLKEHYGIRSFIDSLYLLSEWMYDVQKRLDVHYHQGEYV